MKDQTQNALPPGICPACLHAHSPPLPGLPTVALVGYTNVGKTSLAVELAPRWVGRRGAAGGPGAGGCGGGRTVGLGGGAVGQLAAEGWWGLGCAMDGGALMR